MPPFSTCLAEEGVVIRQFKLMDRGRSRHQQLAAVVAAGTLPKPRSDREYGRHRRSGGGQSPGRERVAGTDRTAQASRRCITTCATFKRLPNRRCVSALERLPDGVHRFVDHLDNGAVIAVAITIEGDRAIVDFQGSGPVQPGNLNANRAIVMAAVMYVFRCLIQEDIPLNQGVLAPIEIRLPPGLLNPPPNDDPSRSAAVAGGNVETSQRIVDVLLGALDAAAASQGTMNNVIFGNDRFGYYETICGGSGATAQSPGADAVHTHMTNTRLTDPEVLELRYPVRLLRFAIRRGSGGRGSAMRRRRRDPAAGVSGATAGFPAHPAPRRVRSVCTPWRRAGSAGTQYPAPREWPDADARFTCPVERSAWRSTDD